MLRRENRSALRTEHKGHVLTFSLSVESEKGKRKRSVETVGL